MTVGSTVVHKYLRPHKKFPHVWCPGCGIGVVTGALVRAIDEVGFDKDEVVMVSGIGCTGRMPVYLDFCSLHTTHGRALPFSTGIKVARPDLKVIAVMGDGDATAIGGNHFIHTARRNHGITAVVVNNNNYGMTGGQYSPTTPPGNLATTAPYGHIEPPFQIVKLAEASGAVFAARATVYHVRLLQRLLKQAIKKDGFSVVEVISNCPVGYGKSNKLGSAVEMFTWQREHAVNIKAAEKMSEEQLQDKFLIGVFVDRDMPEYNKLYDKVIEKAQKKV
jgi:2-oxoglutarate ferredoxin oxidoreductase subunit beta